MKVITVTKSSPSPRVRDLDVGTMFTVLPERNQTGIIVDGEEGSTAILWIHTGSTDLPYCVTPVRKSCFYNDEVEILQSVLIEAE